MSHKIIKYCLSLLCIIIVTSVLIISLEQAVPNYFLLNDNINYYLPTFVHNWRAVVENFTIPLINFHQFLGAPHLAQGQSAVLYPLNYLGVALSQLIAGHPYYTIDILVYLHLVASAIATFYLLRRLKVSHTISLLSALMWITFPYGITISRTWATTSFFMAYLPLNFLFLENLVKKPNLKWILLLAITKALLFFARHPQHSLMLVIFDILFLTALLAPIIDRGHLKYSFRRITAYLLALLLFALFIMPVLIPMFENAQSAPRANQLSYNEFIKYKVTLQTFTDALLFKWNKEVVQKASSEIFYFGFLNVALLLLLLLKNIRTTSKKNHHATIYFLLAIIAFALSTSLLKYFYNIPFFGYFRTPSKYFQFFLFFSALAVAGVAQTIINKKKLISRTIVYTMLTLTLYLNIAVLWQNKYNARNSETMPVPPSSSINNYIAKDGRVFTLYMSNNFNKYYQSLSHNYATLFNLSHFAGYDPFLNDLNRRLTFNLNFESTYNRKLTPEALEHLSKWSVKYILTSYISYADSIEQLRKISVVNGVGIFENTKAKPFVYNPQKPKQKINYTFGINQIDIYPTETTAHTLLVSIAPLPRYYLFINDKKIGRINQLTDDPITINVPANSNKITIEYIDNLFIYGSFISLLTVVSLAGTKYYLDRRSKTSKKLNATFKQQ